MTAAVHSFSTRAEGDFRIDGPAAALAERRRAFYGAAPWTWLNQVHGARVVTVTTPREHAGADADAAVTDQIGAVLAVHTADCVPVLFHDPDAGVIGAAHAGWRGLVKGVLEATVDAMSALGATGIRAHVGPHIRARCYEFGPGELDQVAARHGDGVRARTAWGTPALDLLAGVQSALAGCAADCEIVWAEAGCTACEPDRFYSYRARADTGRHAGAIVQYPSAPGAAS